MQPTEGTYSMTLQDVHRCCPTSHLLYTEFVLLHTHRLFQTLHYVSAAVPSSDHLLQSTVSLLMHKNHSLTLGKRPSLTISLASQQINEWPKREGE